jgi:hypothetical protein
MRLRTTAALLLATTIAAVTAVDVTLVDYPGYTLQCVC